MHFQIRKIVLWSRKPEKNPRVFEFAEGTLNIISGVSRTGKSAIIPIMDYCLGSDKCTIPTGVIRQTTDWFGIVVATDQGEKLLARREPGFQQSTDDMHLLEGIKIETIPQVISKTSTRQAVKQRLDELSGLVKLSFSTEDSIAGLGRASFRDLTAFLFQPQNIVANPNVLFYKADTSEHRQKLRAIFPYVLGAISGETLAKRHQLHQLRIELRRKEHELTSIKTISQRWEATTQALVSEARQLGLIAKDLANSSSQLERLELLREVAAIPRPDIAITTETLQEGVEELNRLFSEESRVAQDLSRLRRRFAEMEQLRSSSDQFRQAIRTQADRLQLSRWLKNNEAESSNCPICGNGLTAGTNQLNTLIESLELLEETAAQVETIPPSFDRELERVRSSITEHTERLRGIRIRQSALAQQSEAARQRQFSVLAASRFLGRLEADLKTLEIVGQDSELQAEVDGLRDRVVQLERDISEVEVAARTRRALNAVNLNAGSIIPSLDAERPNDPISLSDTELTIKVQGPGRDDFLWEIGSGSNWLSYHVAVTLALHQFFINLRACPVPNFIVYDQPSQVYFPKRLADHSEDQPTEPIWRDQDVEAVQRILRGMADAIRSVQNRLQVIVLDHASDSVWGAIPGVKNVEDWREGRALIPADWIS